MPYSKLTFFICLLLVQTSTFAQGERNIWYFGDTAGIDFNSGVPVPLSNSKLSTREGCATACNGLGALLFYTDGSTIWNQNHKVMANGALLSGHESSTQSAIVVKKPEEPNIYYVFTVDHSGGGGLSYSTVDMSKQGGLGEVISTKNVLVVTPTCEKVAAVLHKNKRDYWIITHLYGSDEFHSFLLAPDGLSTNPVITKIGSVVDDDNASNAIGYLKFSRNGKKAAAVHFNLGTVELFDFDNSSGRLKNPIVISGGAPYGAEFSPNGKFLYVSQFFPKIVYQINLLAGSRDNIVKSKITIGTSNGNGGALQLAPNGIIYHAVEGQFNLGEIRSPDNLGVSCNYVPKGFSLSGRVCKLGLPNFLSSSEEMFKVELPDELIKCKKDSVRISASIKDVVALEWSTGDTTSTIWASQIGWYWVEGTSVTGEKLRDSVFVVEGPKKKLYIGPDTSYCGLFKHDIDAGGAYQKYNWNTNETTSQITVNANGTYSVLVLDSSSCSDTDTIKIDRIFKPKIDLTYDSVTCEFVLLSVSSQNKPEVEFIWNTGDTSKQIKTRAKGVYHVTAYNEFCRISDTFLVNKLPTPEVHLGRDTMVCRGFLILSSTEKGKHLWNSGETSSSINLHRNSSMAIDTIWLKVSRNNCSAVDTMFLFPCVDDVVFIPTAFSPNSDNLNDEFRPIGLSHLGNYSFKIYNRWGEKVFDSVQKGEGWNGQYLDKPVQSGVYFYMLNWKSEYGQMINKSGTVTLKR